MSKEDTVEKVEAAAEAVVEKVEEAAKPVVEKVKAAAAKVEAKVEPVVEKVKEEAKPIIKKIEEVVDKVLDKVEEVVHTAFRKKGDWYVDMHCTNCDLCSRIAPANFGRLPLVWKHTVKANPTPETQVACDAARAQCPVQAIHVVE